MDWVTDYAPEGPEPLAARGHGARPGAGGARAALSEGRTAPTASRASATA
jgi:hypothetical protein